MLPPIFFAINTVDANILSEDEVDQIFFRSVDLARPARLVGGTSTSLEAEGTVVDYRLVDGNSVAEGIPRLQGLYETEFLAIAERVFDVELQISPDTISGANVNVLDGEGGRYEWHYDSNPYTGLLALSDVSRQSGGRLLFGREDDYQVPLSLRRGDLLIFDARTTAHAVEPLRRAFLRATVPMNYFLAGEEVFRPADLDSTLYS